MLTELSVTKIKSGPRRMEIHDAHGLYLVIQPSGHRSYAYRYRWHGRPQKMTIGPSVIGLKAARIEAAKAAYELAQGRDPAAPKRAAKEEQRLATGASVDTFRSVAEKFMALEGGKLRSADARRKRLEKYIYPTLGHRPVLSIKRSEVVRLLDEIEVNSGPSMAQAVLAIIKRTLSWFSARSDDYANPLAVRGLGRVNPAERARDRVLSDDELRAVWKAADGFEGPEGRFVQFLLATACRRSEASGMRFDELSGSDWLLPAARNKTGKPLARPLSALALQIIDTTPRISDEFVFSNGQRPLAAYSRFKRRLDEASGVTNWHLHDLRRTSRSLLARAGVTSEVAERCLGHILGGVEGVYNRHNYAVEMRRAYEMLSALIERIISPPPEGKVISMQQRG